MVHKRTTDTASGSDRIIGYVATSVFLNVEPEEIAEDGPDNGNRKLVL